MNRTTLPLFFVAALWWAGCKDAAPGDAQAPTAGSAAEIKQPENQRWQGFDTVGDVTVSVADSFISFIAAPESIRLFWKDSAGIILGSLGAVQRTVEARGQRLRFAMNAGMYTETQGPLGLLISEGKPLHRLNRDTGYGNFYLRPNGVFFITEKGAAGVCRTPDFPSKKAVRWATQSGPMLLIDGRVHHAFKRGSQNVNIRNGVGIMPDGKVLLGISTVPISLWDFAGFFQQRGCRNALYLDGAVSRAFFPDGGLTDTGGAFGVMIGVVE